MHSKPTLPAHTGRSAAAWERGTEDEIAVGRLDADEVVPARAGREVAFNDAAHRTPVLAKEAGKGRCN